MQGSFEDEPFDIEIRGGNAYLSWTGAIRRVVPLATLLVEHERVTAAIAAHTGDEDPPRPARLAPHDKKRCHERATFTGVLPAIDIDNGLAFLVVNEAGHCVCTTVHNFQLFLEDARRTVVAWQGAKGEVLPFKRPDPG